MCCRASNRDGRARASTPRTSICQQTLLTAELGNSISEEWLLCNWNQWLEGKEQRWVGYERKSSKSYNRQARCKQSHKNKKYQSYLLNGSSWLVNSSHIRTANLSHHNRATIFMSQTPSLLRLFDGTPHVLQASVTRRATTQPVAVTPGGMSTSSAIGLDLHIPTIMQRHRIILLSAVIDEEPCQLPLHKQPTLIPCLPCD